MENLSASTELFKSLQKVQWKSSIQAQKHISSLIELLELLSMGTPNEKHAFLLSREYNFNAEVKEKHYLLSDPALEIISSGNFPEVKGVIRLQENKLQEKIEIIEESLNMARPYSSYLYNYLYKTNSHFTLDEKRRLCEYLNLDTDTYIPHYDPIETYIEKRKKYLKNLAAGLVHASQSSPEPKKIMASSGIKDQLFEEMYAFINKFHSQAWINSLHTESLLGDSQGLITRVKDYKLLLLNEEQDISQ